MTAEARGFADGSYQKALKTAKLMATRNSPISEICEMTGLDEKEVTAIVHL